MTAKETKTEARDRRRREDRRKQQVPIDFPDHRKGERRSGVDRRTQPRD